MEFRKLSYLINTILIILLIIVGIISNNDSTKEVYKKQRITFEVTSIEEIDPNRYTADLRYDGKDYTVEVPNELCNTFLKNEFITTDCYYNIKTNDIYFAYLNEIN